MNEHDVPAEPTEDRDEPGAPEGERVATEEASTAELERELRAEIESLRDRLLRLRAEFDNFRKREARERAAAWARAKADLIQKLLGPLEDLRRVAHLDPAATDAASVVEGISLVERKVLEVLEREGLSSVGEPGEPFDPEVHEAIGVWPAESGNQDGRVAAVVSRGYRFGEQLLRPARVHVYEFRRDDTSDS